MYRGNIIGVVDGVHGTNEYVCTNIYGCPPPPPPLPPDPDLAGNAFCLHNSQVLGFVVRCTDNIPHVLDILKSKKNYQITGLLFFSMENPL